MKSIESKRNLSKKSGKIKSKQKRIETKLKQNEIKKKTTENDEINFYCNNSNLRYKTFIQCLFRKYQIQQNKSLMMKDKKTLRIATRAQM